MALSGFLTNEPTTFLDPPRELRQKILLYSDDNTYTYGTKRVRSSKLLNFGWNDDLSALRKKEAGAYYEILWEPQIWGTKWAQEIFDCEMSESLDMLKRNYETWASTLRESQYEDMIGDIEWVEKQAVENVENLSKRVSKHLGWDASD